MEGTDVEQFRSGVSTHADRGGESKASARSVRHTQRRTLRRDGALYGFKIGGGLRLPIWQFHRDGPIPGLRAVLAGLPTDLHRLEVSGFMTTADPDLTVIDEPTSPRDWLIRGGDVAAVVELIEHLDAW